MKRSGIKLLLIVLVVGIFNGCAKKEIINIITVKPEIPLTFAQQFIKDNSIPSQYFIISPGIADYIKGNQGTYVNFAPGSLKFPNGTKVTSGAVQIEFKELYTKGNMILSGIFPISNGSLLVSAGEFYLKATQNGVELFPSDSTSIVLSTPIKNLPADTNQMYSFYSDSVTLFSEKGAHWGVPQKSILRVETTGVYNYELPMAKLKWINCAYYYKPSSLKTKAIAVAQDTTFNTSNSIAFISVNGVNVLVPLSDNNNIPIGSDVTFVAISKKESQFYAAFKKGTIVNNHIEFLTMLPKTITEIRDSLATLK